MNAGLLTSNTVEWETPPEVFAPLHREFGFTLDVCATRSNAKCPRFFTPVEDGLFQSWGKRVVWMNPPYGREIGKWISKAWEEYQKGATVVCLVPARTDTAWWHDFVMNGEIRFLRGRIKFLPSHTPAPFPSAVVIFRQSKIERMDGQEDS